MNNLPPPPPTLPNWHPDPDDESRTIRAFFRGAKDSPNWYPDPDDESKYRYWDGKKWTEHYAPRQLDSTNTPNKDNPAFEVKAQHADSTKTAPAFDKGTPPSLRRSPWRPWGILIGIISVLVVIVVGCQTLTTHRHGDYEHSHYWHVWADGHCHIGLGDDVQYNTDLCG